MSSVGAGTPARATKMGRSMTKWELLKLILRRPSVSCLTYAPWRGHFGVHYTTQAGMTYKKWTNNPFEWYGLYTRIQGGPSVKAAFLYFRLTKDRPAVTISTYIKKESGVRHVKGNAQQ